MRTENNVTEGNILSKILPFRNQKVILDRDLAELYGVETKYLKRQVRRNPDRFPEDFMFILSNEEMTNLRSQFGSSSWGGNRYPPMAFTEHGVAMLSSVVNSPIAISLNIQIMRIFTSIRNSLTTELKVTLELEEIKKKLTTNSKNIELVFKYLDKLIEKSDSKIDRKRIGYKK